MAKEVRLSDSSVNSYGYRVLTSGIDLEQYKKNPILLFMHNRPVNGTIDEIGVIGKMTNLRIENDALIGTPEFNLADDNAKKIAQMWDNDMLNMVSIGADILETSTAKEHILEGQQYATVTRCKLREVSIVDIGANDNAIKLSFNGENDIKKILNKIDMQESNVQEKNNEIQLEQQNVEKLEDVEPVEKEQSTIQLSSIVKRLEKLEATLSTKIEQLEEDRNVDVVLSKVDEAIQCGKINADKKQAFVEIGQECGCELLSKIFDNMEGAVRASNLIEKKEKTAVKLSDLTSEQLNEVYNNNKDLYAQLYKEEYGIMPN